MLSPDQPRFHLASQSGGWSSDPNGPFFYKGWWHLFHQHLPGSSKWDWGLQWSHAVSRDKVHWRPLPPAIVPTPGGLDQDGAFSGCACIDEETGIPYLFYTGVRLRSSPTCGPIPPAPYDLNLPFIESQLIAWPADPEDPLLQVWVKGDVPIISLPLPNVDLAGWRDAFLVCTPTTSPERVYKIMFGSGIKSKGGLILVYKSKKLTHGWEFDKFMCVGKHEGPTGITGIMWEMPLLAKLPITTGPLPVALGALQPPKADAAAAQRAPVPSAAAQTPLALAAMLSAAAQPLTKLGALPANGWLHDTLGTLADMAGPAAPLNPNYLQLPEDDASQPQHNRYFFSISPDACTCPTLYWLGNCPTYDTFDVHNADGPHKLDLGDVLYAPNLYKDPEGRILLLAWMQERRKVGEYAYAGCVSLPRMLTMDVSDPTRPRLLQQPMPELTKLRTPGRQYILGSPAPSAELPHVEVDTDDFTAHQLKHRDSLSPLEDVGWQEAGRAQRHAAMMMEDEYAEGATARQEHRKGTQAQGALLAANGAGGGNGIAAPRVGVQERAGNGLTGNGHAAFAPAASHKHNGAGGAVCAHAAAAEPSDTIMVHGGQAVTIPGVSGPFLDIEIALMPANPADGLLQPRSAPEAAAAAEAHQGAADGQGQGQVQPEGTQGQGAVDGAADVQPPAADAAADGEPQANGGSQEMQGLMSGLALRSWVSGGSAAVLYNWREGTLEVVYEATEPGTHNFSLAAPDVRRVGGVLRRPPAAGEPLRLRLLLDGSLLEIFTGEGEALSTRVYRGVPPTNDAEAVVNGNGPGAVDPVSSCAIDLISVNGDTVVKRLEAYEMESIWEEVMPGPVPAAQAVEELIQAALKL